MSKINFNTYKNSRRGVESVLETIKLNTKQDKKVFEFDDEKFFRYTKDKAGNAFAIIRFLPCVYEDQGSPVVMRYRHFFSNKGKWLIENCPTTPIIKGKCPICEDNAKWWTDKSSERIELGTDYCEKIGRERKRRTEFFANIYIIKDSQNPKNEGKVKIWQFGPKVMEKIDRALKPTTNDIAAGKKPVDVFDLESGANFVLNVFTDKYGFSKYDECTFQQSSPLFEDNTKLQTVYDVIYNLYEFKDSSSFKSYEELKTKLNYVLGSGLKNDGAKKETPKENIKKSKEPLPEKKEIKEEKKEEKKEERKDESASEENKEDIDSLFDDFV